MKKEIKSLSRVFKSINDLISFDTTIEQRIVINKFAELSKENFLNFIHKFEIEDEYMRGNEYKFEFETYGVIQYMGNENNSKAITIIIMNHNL